MMVSDGPESVSEMQENQFAVQWLRFKDGIDRDKIEVPTRLKRWAEKISKQGA